MFNTTHRAQTHANRLEFDVLMCVVLVALCRISKSNLSICTFDTFCVELMRIFGN